MLIQTYISAYIFIHSEYTKNVTLECYNADSAKPLGSVGLSNILKQTSSVSDAPSGNERRGSTWDELFKGLQNDITERSTPVADNAPPQAIGIRAK